MKQLYRLSDSGGAKVKPYYVNNHDCLRNFMRVFGVEGLEIFADNARDATLAAIARICPNVLISRIALGNSGSFDHILTRALKLTDDDIVYFVEGDYLHHPGSPQILLEGFEIGADYVTLYDHPDKYTGRTPATNPLIKDGGETTRVLLSRSCHWKQPNSTTMTFAARVHTLRRDAALIREHLQDAFPRDFQLFLELRARGRVLLSPLPGYSTHGETEFLGPLVDWEKV